MKTRHRLFAPADRYDQHCHTLQREADQAEREEETSITEEAREARKVDLQIDRNLQEERI